MARATVFGEVLATNQGGFVDRGILNLLVAVVMLDFAGKYSSQNKEIWPQRDLRFFWAFFDEIRVPIRS